MRLVQPPRLSRQPSQAPRVDQSNPFARGLAFLASAIGATTLYNALGGGAKFAPNATAVQSVVASSVGYTISGGSVSGLDCTVNLTSSIGTGDFAFFFYTNSTGSGTQILIGDTGSSTLFGQDQFSQWNSFLSSIEGPPTTTAMVPVLWTRKAGVEYIYVGNVVVSGASTVSFPSAGATTLLCRTQPDDYSWSGNLAMFACWPNRGFAPVEARQLIANPWQLFSAGPRALWLNALGGSVFNLSCIELGSGLDSAASALSAALAASETGSALDALVAAMLAAQSMAESGSAAEVEAGAVAVHAALTEAGAGAESESASMSASALATESGSASDSTIGSLAGSAGIIEAAAGAESIGHGLSAPLALSEAASAADSIASQLQAALSSIEAATAVDTVTFGSSSVSVAISEASVAGDAASQWTAFILSLAELGAGADLVAAMRQVGAVVSEAGVGIDASTFSSGASVSLAMSEASSARDALLLLSLHAVDAAYVATGAPRNYLKVGAARNYYHSGSAKNYTCTAR